MEQDGKRWKFPTFFPARLARPGRPGRAGRPGPGLWRGTQAVAPKASQLGCREAAPKARRLAPKAPPSAPKAPKCPQNTRKCPGHAQCVTGAGQVSRLLSPPDAGLGPS
eukprot:gene12582-biopygen6457